MDKITIKYNLFILPAFIALLFSSSCKSVVNVDLPNYTPQLVVNCLLTPDNYITAEVSHSLKSLDDAPLQPLTNARVELYKDGFFVDTLKQLTNGNYSDSIYPEAGHAYKLIVTAAGFTSVEGETIVPVAVPVNNYSVTDSAFADKNGVMQGQVTLSFQDAPGVANYYSVILLDKDALTGLSLPANISSNNPVFDNSDNKGLPGLFFNDQLFDGLNYAFTIQTPASNLNSSSAPYLQFASMNKEAYLYIKTLNTQKNTKNNPFAEPTPVYTNIKNGLGIIGAYNSVSVKLK